MTDAELNRKFKDLTDLIDQSMHANARQFEAIEKRFGSLETKMDAGFQEVNSRIDSVEARLSSIERRFEADVTWRDQAERRIKRLEVEASLPPLEEAA